MLRLLLFVSIIIFSTLSVGKSIVVLGDSISAGYGMSLEKAWVNLLQKKLSQENYSYQVINESISGDTTHGGLARIDSVLKKHQPTIILIELGANDGLRGHPPLLIKKNLRELIKKSQNAGANVVLLSMRIPTNYGKRYTDLFYDNYSDLAKEMSVHVVPFILDKIATNQHLMQADGLHPNDHAQPMIVENIWPFLAPILSP